MAIKNFVHRILFHAAGADGAGGGGGAGAGAGTGAGAGSGGTGAGGGTGEPQNLIQTRAAGGAGAPPAGTGQQQGAPPAGGAEQNGKWFLSEGLEGTGQAPEWFDGKKYKSVAEQARAYKEANKELDAMRAKLKGFAGPPADNYQLSMPDQLKEVAEWTADDPFLTEVQQVARESGMSQDTFSKLLHIYARHEYQQEAIDLGKEKAALGERADERLGAFDEWANANLSEEQLAQVMRPLSRNARPADVFKAFEHIMSALRSPPMHREGDDVPTNTGPATQDAWRSKWYAKSEVKGHAYKIDEPGARAIAKKELANIVGEGDHIEVVGKGGGKGAKRA